MHEIIPQWALAGYLAGRKPTEPPIHHAAPPRAKPSKPADSPYLTIDEAAEYCRLAKKTLYNHRSEIARMPGTGKLLFRREELDQWLSNRPKKKRRRI